MVSIRYLAAIQTFSNDWISKDHQKGDLYINNQTLGTKKIVLVEIEAASYLLCPPYGKSYPSKINIMDGSLSITFHTGIFKYGNICLNKVDKNLESDEVSSFTSPMLQIKYDSTLE